MKLIRYSDFDTMPSTFSTLLDKVFSESVNASRIRRFRPDVDIVETDNAYEIHLSVPGMEKDGLKIDLNDGVLTITVERKLIQEKEKRQYHTVETQYGSFSRTFNLPDHVVTAKIQANYTEGILVITLPKDEKLTLKTTIKVK